ncbi:MAG: DNA internalization-related competence protein ComEC/Rec2 [Gammaproteobacteria bacterium]|nr:DNA internalization-related competence protein ComEC/Rec2 [Gammaproteobacteria bacterium]
MLRFCVLLLVGAYSMVLALQAPARSVALFVAVVALLSGRYRCSRPLAVFLLGWLISGLTAMQLASQQLDPALEGKTLVVRVQIADFAATRGDSLRFVAVPVSPAGLPAKIRLSWFDAGLEPAIGESWQLRVRLRRPRGFSNPGGFDYENWLFRSSIGATGYVLDGQLLEKGYAGPRASIVQLRARSAQRLQALLPPDEARAVLMAITVGAKHEVSPDAWSRYARTGTSHLMAISGLHIGLAGGLAYAVTWLLTALLLPRANLRVLSVVCTVPVVVGYAAISGLGIPAQRAALMSGLAVAGVLLRRPLRSVRQLALVCVLTIIVNPLIVWAPGFQLSFAAVAILLIAAGHWRGRPDGPAWHSKLSYRLRDLWSVQLLLLFGLFGLTAMQFGRAALLAPLVNMIVLPVFGFVSVPLGLGGLLMAGPTTAAGDLLLQLAHRSIRLVTYIIECADLLPLSRVSLASLSRAGHAAACLACVYVLLPRGWPGRGLAVVAVSVAILSRPAALPARCMELSVLDVGQGMSVVLRTRDHTVLFDTGPRFRGGADAAQLVVVPFLNHLAVNDVDLLIISHADLDHAGGVNTLLARKSVTAVVAGEVIPGLPAAEACHAGQVWQFNDMRLQVLHPRRDSAWSGNNASCVVLASLGRHRLLLTGDIESTVERMLADMPGVVDTVVVPHHGSNTSSSSPFVQALKPGLAIVSAGYRNRWGLPTPAVIDRWRSTGAQLVTTAEGGALSQRFCRGQVPAELRRHRSSSRRFWTQPL